MMFRRLFIFRFAPIILAIISLTGILFWPILRVEPTGKTIVKGRVFESLNKLALERDWTAVISVNNNASYYFISKQVIDIEYVAVDVVNEFNLNTNIGINDSVEILVINTNNKFHHKPLFEITELKLNNRVIYSESDYLRAQYWKKCINNMYFNLVVIGLILYYLIAKWYRRKH